MAILNGSTGGNPPRSASRSLLRAVRIALWLAVAGGGALSFVGGVPGAASSEPRYNGTLIEQTEALPPFDLMRADGRAFSIAETRGRVSLFAFGFTDCPDVCPTTLLELGNVQRRLGDRAGAVDVYLVTVDPERDTPERLLEYMLRFGGNIVALTGTPDQLERSYRAFGVYAARSGRSDEGQAAVVHTASTFLVDGTGRLRLVFPSGMHAALIADDAAKFTVRSGLAGVVDRLTLGFAPEPKR